MGLTGVRRFGVAVVSLGVLAWLPSCQLPTPAQFTVNDTADTVDASPGDGLCATATGTCTLRAAVQEANADPGEAVVTLQAGATYTLNIAFSTTGEDAAAVGDLDVNDPLVIEGQGAAVQGNSSLQPGGGQDRIFDNRSTLRLDNLNVRFGSDVENVDSSHDGGAVRNAGQLIVAGSHLTQNLGGSITQASGSMVVVDSQIEVGLPEALRIDGGTAIVVNSAIVNNAGNPLFTSNNGGIVQAGGTLTVVNATVGGQNATFTIFNPSCIPLGCPISVTSPAIDHQGGTLYVALTTFYSSQFSIEHHGVGPVTVTGSALDPPCSVTVGSGGHNVENGATCLDGSNGTDVRSAGLLFGGTNLVPPAGSPLLDAIPVGTANLCDGTIGTDERHQPRPAGPACDVGAFERQLTD